MSIETMKQALEALEKCNSALAEELSAWDIDPPLHHVLEASNACDPAITALRQAIEQAQEPVAWLCMTEEYSKIVRFEFETFGNVTPLYTSPPQRQPLTDEMQKQMKERCDSMEMRGAFADGWLSAEAAHGITGEQA